MSVYKIKSPKLAEPLLKDISHETFVYSYLQGYSGIAYTDNLDKPKSIQLIVGDFCIFSGEVNKELVKNKPEDRTSHFVIMVPENEEWGNAIEGVYLENAVKRTRFAIKKQEHFNQGYLNAIVCALPKEYTLSMIDECLYNEIAVSPWAKDLCSTFKNYEAFLNNGLGCVVLKNGEIVAGASSYICYDGGIEIEIDTREDMRRQGLALVTGAKLILECIERNLYPSWDAHNIGSVKLAEKLGYEFDHEYTAYDVTW